MFWPDKEPVNVQFVYRWSILPDSSEYIYANKNRSQSIRQTEHLLQHVNKFLYTYCLINITYVHRDMDLVGHVIEIPCKVRSNHIYKPINFLTLLYVTTFTKSKLFRIFNPSDNLYLVLWLLSSQDQLLAFWPSSFLGSGIKSWNSLQSSSCVHPLLCGW